MGTAIRGPPQTATAAAPASAMRSERDTWPSAGVPTSSFSSCEGVGGGGGHQAGDEVRV